jgi:CheY-like chemotaxis protein
VPSAPGHGRPPGELVLVACDDPAALASAAAALEAGLGTWTITASDGDGALRWLRSVLPAVVLLDLRRRGSEAREVCRRIKACPATAGVPVVVAGRADRCPADGLLPRPYGPRDLLRRVGAWIGPGPGPGR